MFWGPDKDIWRTEIRFNFQEDRQNSLFEHDRFVTKLKLLKSVNRRMLSRIFSRKPIQINTVIEYKGEVINESGFIDRLNPPVT